MFICLVIIVCVYAHSDNIRPKGGKLMGRQILFLSGRWPNTFTTHDGPHKHSRHGLRNPIKMGQ